MEPSPHFTFRFAGMRLAARPIQPLTALLLGDESSPTGSHLSVIISKAMKTACLVGFLTLAAFGQTRLRSVQSSALFPDPHGTVAAAKKSLAADPKSPALLLKLAQAQIAYGRTKRLSRP